MSRSRSRYASRSLVIALAAALALTASPTGALGRSAPAPLPDPRLHYSMDGISGTTVPDRSANRLNGTLAGPATVVDVDADGGTGLQLPGGPQGGHVVLPRGALEGARDLTVSTRINWDGDGGAWQ